MNLFDLNHDILELVVDEVFRWRKKVCAKELRSEWRRRRGRRHMVRSQLRIGPLVHEGRGMLCDTDHKASTLGMIRVKDEKYFICGIQAFPFISNGLMPLRGRCAMAGMSLRIPKSSGKIIDLGFKNGWDFNGQTDATVVRYLMDKEEERTD